MQVHILSSTARVGSKDQHIFTESILVIFHSKLKGMEHNTPIHAHSLSLYTPSTPGWGQKSKTFVLLKVVMLHIK